MHLCVGKETCTTTHVEYWNNTLGQKIEWIARKTPSFHDSNIHMNSCKTCISIMTAYNGYDDSILLSHNF